MPGEDTPASSGGRSVHCLIACTLAILLLLALVIRLLSYDDGSRIPSPSGALELVHGGERWPDRYFLVPKGSEVSEADAVLRLGKLDRPDQPPRAQEDAEEHGEPEVVSISGIRIGWRSETELRFSIFGDFRVIEQVERARGVRIVVESLGESQ